jgi:hypothetical protein
MRLFELIDFEPRDSIQTANKIKNRISSNTTAKNIGQGAFATAYDTGSAKRLNQVTKVGRTGEVSHASKSSTAKSVDEDGFLVYLKHVVKEDNPYYPELHDLVVRKNKSGTLDYTANLHKLSPFRSEKIYGNIDLMTSLCDDMFYGREYGYFDPHEPGNSIRQMLDTSSHMPEIIKDPDLKVAMKTIVGLGQKHNFMLDLHAGNIMWRINGYRPQLIIYDPLA